MPPSDCKRRVRMGKTSAELAASTPHLRIAVMRMCQKLCGPWHRRTAASAATRRGASQWHVFARSRPARCLRRSQQRATSRTVPRPQRHERAFHQQPHMVTTELPRRTTASSPTSAHRGGARLAPYKAAGCWGADGFHPLRLSPMHGSGKSSVCRHLLCPTPSPTIHVRMAAAAGVCVDLTCTAEHPEEPGARTEKRTAAIAPFATHLRLFSRPPPRPPLRTVELPRRATAHVGASYIGISPARKPPHMASGEASASPHLRSCGRLREVRLRPLRLSSKRGPRRALRSAWHLAFGTHTAECDKRPD
mmetsp:Transcript_70137/g.203379  ORF Transcript_70137/g.203379 Transcript_70137/m.203379 type:complete len:306 (+) Transcript_70137:363-1280(+)